jgi:hypothetical protein
MLLRCESLEPPMSQLGRKRTHAQQQTIDETIQGSRSAQLKPPCARRKKCAVGNIHHVS